MKKKSKWTQGEQAKLHSGTNANLDLILVLKYNIYIY